MLYLVTGGSASGKSEYAEEMAVSLQRKNKGGLFYVAAMYPFDEECKDRIRKHQNMRRDKGFVTIECYTRVEQIKGEKGGVYLLECMSNLLANEMYQEEGRLKELSRMNEQAGKEQVREVIADPLITLSRTADVIVVSNEVFSDGVFYGEEMKRYVQALGMINVLLGEAACFVAEAVCKIPVIQKGEELCGSHL